MAKRQTKPKSGKAKEKAQIAANKEMVAAVMAIEKSNQAGVTGAYDAGINASVKAAQEYHAKNAAEGPLRVYGAHDQLARIVCIPMPALAPRFLMQLEGWPLGRFVLVDGFKESCKSAFLNEVGVWHRRLRGLYGVIETEVKDAAGLRDSFFNYDRSAWKLIPASSQEEWNHGFFWFIKELQTIMDGHEEMVEEKGKRKKVFKPGTGRIAPACIAVDSISAVVIDRLRDKMLEEGSPELSHPLGARLLSDFFKVAPKELADYPITFMAVSHLREVSNNPRMPQIKSKVTTGGEAPKYQMSTEIEMQRKGAGQYTRSHPLYGDIHAIDLQMHIRKNSLAPHEWIGVEMVWYFDPNDIDPLTRQPRQKSYFDWHSASIDLLIDCMKAGSGQNEFSSRRAKELREIIDIQQDGDRRMASSATLGISDKHPISYFDLGLILEQKIQNDPQFCLDLYNIMGIRRQFMFEPGVCFKTQIANNTARMIAAETGVKLEASPSIPLPAAVEVPVEKEYAVSAPPPPPTDMPDVPAYVDSSILELS